MKSKFRVELLDKSHKRSSFTSSSEALNDYFHRHVSQDVRRRITTCFVAISEDERVAGFYTLASSSILLSDLPEELIKKLPRYPIIPALCMGRLAIDASFSGQGLGAALLADALTRGISSEIASYALVVDAKDEKAADFYRHHGFINFEEQSLKLFISFETVKKLFNL